MKRLRGLILLFMAAMAVPLGYFILHAHRSFDQEETAEFRYFGASLFDEMEQSLAALVRREESRPVNAYHADAHPLDGSENTMPSPLSVPPAEAYIIGYFQNNPDGTFQAPIMDGAGLPPLEGDVMETLRRVNRIFNEKLATREPSETEPPAAAPPAEAAGEGFSARYLKRAAPKPQAEHLGRKERQVQELTADEAVTLSRKVRPKAPAGRSAVDEGENARPAPDGSGDAQGFPAGVIGTAPAPDAAGEAAPPEALRVEIDPLQSVRIDAELMLIYRRILLGNQVFRQGFVVQVDLFLEHVMETRFSGQPMSRFAQLTLQVAGEGQPLRERIGGAPVSAPRITISRTFPRPFSFLTATLVCRELPRSSGRDTLNIMIAILTIVVLAGFFAVYRSAGALLDLSERRSRFVSSVTHELKTPLTNIRMYVEMLEQGIASSPEREQEYLRVLGSESARLARLINNILEFSKLEKRELRLQLMEGSLGEAAREAARIMQEALRKAGVSLDIQSEGAPAAVFDREMMIQVMVNLLENSIKFGRRNRNPQIIIRILGEGEWVRADVIDTGPGIPRKDLKRVFDDFYRVESALVRSTRGTGIGLAFVRKVVTAMGGRVSAANNDGPGCTLTVRLPKQQ